MHDGSVVIIRGRLYKRVRGMWAAMIESAGYRSTDAQILESSPTVLLEANPLDGLEEGAIVTGPRKCDVAIKKTSDEWFGPGMIGVSDEDVLRIFGNDLVVVRSRG